MIRRVILWCAIVVALASPATAQTIILQCDFETPGVDGLYGCFDGLVTPFLPTGKTVTHLPTGGFGGTGGVQFTATPCVAGPGCSNAENQGNMGFRKNALGGSYTLGDSLFIHWDQIVQSSVPGSHFGNKLVILGQGGAPGSRVIFQHDPPYGTNAGCQPSGEGNDFYGGAIVPDPTEPPNVWLRATHFGFGSSWISQAGGVETNATPYSTIAPHIGISHNCTVFALLAGPTASIIKPQETSTIASDRFVCLRFEVISGADGDSGFRAWYNNATQASPSAQTLNMDQPSGDTNQIPTATLTGAIDFGGFIGLGPATEDVAWVMDNLVVSTGWIDDETAHGDAPANTAIPARKRLRAMVLNPSSLAAGLVSNDAQW